MTPWGVAQEYEAKWWGDCLDTLGEEIKQTVYARAMQIPPALRSSVLDIGGGPVSMLLKIKTKLPRVVCDPLPMPDWVRARYHAAGILLASRKAEEFLWGCQFDEVWIYNVLQHVEDPQKVIAKARKHGKLIRVFDWIEMKPGRGHIHTLREQELNEWLHGRGFVMHFNESGCCGKAYFGTFEGHP